MPLYCAGLYRNLAELFGGMSIVSVILVGLGLMLIIVEFFQPSYRFPTICGAVLVPVGIAVRMLAGGTFIMLFYMVFFCVVVLLAAHMLMLVTQKKAWLMTSLAMQLTRTIMEAETDYESLLGRDGVATTDIDTTGHMAIDDVNFLVSSDDFIPQGTSVRVVHVMGDSVKVVAIYKDDTD